MNIIFANETDLVALKSKYTVLELDTMRFADSNVVQTAWCLISADNITLQDLPLLERYQDLHNNMMRNYRLKNWKYCEEAIEHLLGRWKGELDSFYMEIADRLKSLKNQELDSNWDGAITKRF